MGNENTNLPAGLFDEFGRPIFDKTRLTRDPEFTQYLYEIEFKEKPTLDMRAGGYMHAIRPYLLTYKPEVITTTTTNVGGYIQVKLQITLLSGLVYVEVSDAFGSLRDTPLRLAVTSAFKRGVARILDISQADFGSVNHTEFNIGKYAYGISTSERKRRAPRASDVIDSSAKRMLERQASRKRIRDDVVSQIDDAPAGVSSEESREGWEF
jgi:hypothetical protein